MKRIDFASIIGLVIYGYGIITYIINLVQLFNCDFDAPYKDELIKGIGALFPPLNCITVWF